MLMTMSRDDSESALVLAFLDAREMVESACK
jgi:hypothetical protein